MLNLGPLRSFVAVAETGGIRPAARRLGLSPAAVTDHLAQIEAQLGAALVQRRARGIDLLAQGEALLPLARALLDTAARAERVVAGRGLALAAASNAAIYMLAPLIAGFERAGGPPVDLWIGPNPQVEARLLDGRADCAVMEWWAGRPGFAAHAWREEPLVLITAPDHPWALRGRVGIEDLASETLLGGEPGSGTGRVLRAALGDMVDRLRLRGGFNGTEAVKRGVRAGLGVSLVLAPAVREEIAAGTLAAPALDNVRLVKTLWIVQPRGTPETAPAARLARHLAAPSG